MERLTKIKADLIEAKNKSIGESLVRTPRLTRLPAGLKDTHQEISAETIELFNVIDHDGSGTITRDEFLTSCFKFSEHVDKTAIEKTLNELDSDGDGVISLVEFAKVFGHIRVKISKSEARFYFGSYDIDGSGTITVAELRHMMTALGYALCDDEMDVIFGQIDADGDGHCEFAEFEKLLELLDFDIVDDEDFVNDEDLLAATQRPPKPRQKAPRQSIALNSSTASKVLMDKFGCVDGGLDVARLKRAAELLEAEEKMEANPTNPRFDPALHWDPKRQLRGLGAVMYKCNHIAIIVSDVGRSASFYGDVIGLQPIRRPNFDRHGAWFTMGNVELHLIKGTPTVYQGDDLVVGHISLEVRDVERVPQILRSKGVPFRRNVTVPKGNDSGVSGTNVSTTNKAIVVQYFFRDPDGYYLEVCNCDVLTDYCIGKKDLLIGYQEGVKQVTTNDAVRLSLIGLRISKLAHASWYRLHKLMDGGLKGKPHATIAKALGCTPADTADKTMLKSLIVRLSVYGDIVQNETAESLENILKLTGNNMQHAQEVMLIHAGEVKKIQPPAFYEGDGETLVKPESLALKKSTNFLPAAAAGATDKPSAAAEAAPTAAKSSAPPLPKA